MLISYYTLYIVVSNYYYYIVYCCCKTAAVAQPVFTVKICFSWRAWWIAQLFIQTAINCNYIKLKLKNRITTFYETIYFQEHARIRYLRIVKLFVSPVAHHSVRRGGATKTSQYNNLVFSCKSWLIRDKCRCLMINIFIR